MTVIVPVHDRADLLAAALRSVEAQQSPPAEVIVVDDGSADGSADVALRFGATVIRQEQSGVSSARNAGLKAARTRHVAFLDSDDEWLPGHLTTLTAVRPDVPLVSTAAVTSARALVGSQRLSSLRLRSADRLVWPDNPVVTSSTRVDRRIALDIGGFDTALAHSEDLDLWARLLARGNAVVLPRVTVRYRLHPGQVSTDVESMRRGTARLLERGAISRRTARRAAIRDDWDRRRSGTAEAAPRSTTSLTAASSVAALVAHRLGGRIAAAALLPRDR